MGPVSYFKDGSLMGPPYFSSESGDQIQFTAPDPMSLENLLVNVIKLRGCGGPDRQLPEFYIKNTLNYIITHPQNSIVLIACEFIDGHEPILKGYLLGFGKPTNLHLQIVCAETGWGAILIQKLTDFADSIHVNIELDALERVLYYYQNYGFVFKNKCEDPDVFIDKDRSLKDQALYHLVQNNINVYKGEGCNKNFVVQTEAERQDNICYMDGFRMQRCHFPVGNPFYVHDEEIHLEEIGNDTVARSRGIYERLKLRADYTQSTRLRKSVRS